MSGVDFPTLEITIKEHLERVRAIFRRLIDTADALNPSGREIDLKISSLTNRPNNETNEELPMSVEVGDKAPDSNCPATAEKHFARPVFEEKDRALFLSERRYVGLR